MYLSDYQLGTDLTAKDQKLLTRAQKQVARLTPIVAAAQAGKKKGARQRLAKAQATVARLTTSPVPPESPIATTTEVQPTPASMTSVYQSGGGGEPAPAEPTAIEQAVKTATETVSNIPIAYLAIGGIALFMLLKRSR